MKIELGAIAWGSLLLGIGYSASVAVMIYTKRREVLARWRSFPLRENLVGLSLTLRCLSFPAAILLGYAAFLFLPDQSGALLRSLSAGFYLNKSGPFVTGGFEATRGDAASWIFANLLLLSVLWTYYRRFLHERATRLGAAGLRMDVTGGAAGALLLSGAAQTLFLVPLLASPLMRLPVGVAAATAILVPASLLRASRRLNGSRDVTVTAFVMLSFGAVSAMGLWFISFPIWLLSCLALIVRGFQKRPPVSFAEVLDFALLAMAAFFALYFSAFLHIAMQGDEDISVLPAVALTLVWTSPSLLALGFFKAPGVKSRRWWLIVASFELGAVVAACAYVLIWNATTAVCTVPLFFAAIAILVLIGQAIASYSKRRFYERLDEAPPITAKGPYVAVGAAGIARVCRWGRAIHGLLHWIKPRAVYLFPWLVVGFAGYAIYAFSRLPQGWLQADQHFGEVRAKHDDEFGDYATQWKHAHGDGPVIIVAAAGGGVRAAQHVAASLAHADELSQGAFGERIFAISAVSGGALGTLVWDAARRQGILPLAATESGQAQFRSSEIIGEYFTADLLSPSENLFLLHDLPLSAAPFVRQPALRDDALIATWSHSWAKLASVRAKHGPDAFQELFPLSKPEYGVAPLLLFNSTSAADGRRAVRSNVPLAMQDALMLTPSVPAVVAAYDSARFPLVSSVGTECADADTPAKSQLVHTKDCSREPGYPNAISVTDGGFADNSGLESAQEVVARLKARSDFRAEDIYVVYITSNPLEGHAYIDGDRFDSSSLLGTVFAPFSMMEAARAGRAQAAFEAIGPELCEHHLLQWSLTGSAGDLPNTAYIEMLTQRRDNIRDPKRISAGVAGKVIGYDDRWYNGTGLRDAFGPNDINKLDDSVLLARDMPPLGWTLDPSSVRGIDTLAAYHSETFENGCKSQDTGEAGFCRRVLRLPPATVDQCKREHS